VCGPIQTNFAVAQYLPTQEARQTIFQGCYNDVALTAQVGFAQVHLDAVLVKGKLTQPEVQVVLPVSPIRTTASGPGVQAQVPAGGEATFYIQPRDATGAAVAAGSAALNFVIGSTGQLSFSQPFLRADGTYAVSYNAVPGLYDISVSVNGGDNLIAGSPFRVLVTQG